MLQRLTTREFIHVSIALLVFLFIVPLAAPAMAAGKASLVISQFDSSRFPTTVVYATVLSDKGYPVAGLTGASFQVLENGSQASNVSVTAAVDSQEPLAAVLALDVSGSMNGEAMQALRAAALTFVDGLRPQDEAGVIAFSSDVRTAAGLTTDRPAVSNSIATLAPGGNTALYDALFASVDATSNAAPQRRVVVLMTDGFDTSSKASLDDGLNLATQLGVPVFTIGLGSDIRRDLLSRIAQRTGGASLFAPSPEALHAAYQTISDQLRNQYVLSYQSPAPKGARTYHVAITATVGNETFRTERTYEATPAAPTITALSVSDGARVEGIVPMAVEVSSTLPITAARLLINGRIQEELTAPPYTFSLDASRLSPGRQEMVVSAVDAAGSEVSRRVQVLVPPPLPAQGVDAPAAPQTTRVQAPSIGPAVSFNPSSFLESGLTGMMNAMADRWAEITRAAVPGSDILQPPGQEVLASVQRALTTVAQFPEQAITAIGNASQQLTAAGGLVVEQTSTSVERSVHQGTTALAGLVEESAPRVGLFGLLCAASMLGLFGVRRTVAIGRQRLGSTVCPTCNSQYRVFEDECPVCREQEEESQLEERSLGEFLVQNNLLSPDQLAVLVQRSRERGKSLEMAALEEGAVSVQELSQARFYLAQSSEMRGRLHDFAHAKAQSNSRLSTHLLRLLPTVSLPVLLLACSVTTWTVALPMV